MLSVYRCARRSSDQLPPAGELPRGTSGPTVLTGSQTCACPSDPQRTLPSTSDRWLSSQSLPQIFSPWSVMLQHAVSTRPSPSESLRPIVLGSQSSSWLNASQTSGLPGNVDGSPSSQSAPWNSTESMPSRS